MYAMLGSVRFEFLSGFTSFEEAHKALFAKHEVLAGRPRLQAMGNDLTSVNFSLRLHWRLGNPDTSYKGLIAAKESQQAQALVFGSGRFVGWFVIESINSRSTQQDTQGRTAAREMDVELTEFVGDPNNPLPTPGIGGGLSPLLSLLPESVRGVVNDVTKAVQTGVRIYNTAVQTVDKVQTLITQAKQLQNNPTAAFGLLGDALNLGAAVSTNLSELPVIGQRMGNLTGVSDMLTHAAAAAAQVDSAVNSISGGISSGTIGTWLDNGAASIEQAADSLSNAAGAVQGLTGWIATRSDNGGAA